jgi:hypothetical protein
VKEIRAAAGLEEASSSTEEGAFSPTEEEKPQSQEEDGNSKCPLPYSSEESSAMADVSIPVVATANPRVRKPSSRLSSGDFVLANGGGGGGQSRSRWEKIYGLCFR